MVRGVLRFIFALVVGYSVGVIVICLLGLMIGGSPQDDLMRDLATIIGGPIGLFLGFMVWMVNAIWRLG